jgi:hypothetical protein
MPHFDADRRIEATQIHNRIREIAESTYSQRQPIENLEICVTGPGKGPERPPQSGWKPFKALGTWGGFEPDHLVPNEGHRAALDARKPDGRARADGSGVVYPRRT